MSRKASLSGSTKSSRLRKDSEAQQQQETYQISSPLMQQIQQIPRASFSLSTRSSAKLQPPQHLQPQEPNRKRMVLVTVEDTGIGISDENKQHLFKPFKQAQRSAGGTGLGLFSLSKRIEALEGKCGVRDRSDGKQGSVFWFTFPYRPDFIAAKEYEQMMLRTSSRSGSQHSDIPNSSRKALGASTARENNASYPDSPIPPLSILLTDDSPSILKVTTRFLEKSGHNVETAENGNQCLERLKEGRRDFDMLITDLQMPVMDGFESVRRFRSFERASIDKLGNGLPPPPLLIVGMSAKADEVTKKEALAAGMDLFLTKPFRYDQLVEVLQQSGKTMSLKDSVKIFGRDYSNKNVSTRSSMEIGQERLREYRNSAESVESLTEDKLFSAAEGKRNEAEDGGGNAAAKVQMKPSRVVLEPPSARGSGSRPGVGANTSAGGGGSGGKELELGATVSSDIKQKPGFDSGKSAQNL
jgi:CheY-like chemotaxis protein